LLLSTSMPDLCAADLKDAKAPIEFNRDIRPILSDACFHCHGPDKAKRKADLRLDNPEGGQAVLVSGKPAESELFRRITAKDDSKLMPPPKSGRRLTAQQIALLGRWIEQGAKWQPHWAFIAPARPPLPQREKNAPWIRNPIDHFVLAKLQAAGLTPSTEAPKTTLIRRVTLDLTGLPPTPEEVDAYLKDESPDAYERVVDRLQRSPRYGERMALDWLDAARYADSNGYQQDRTRTLWPWRDWVIEAFNQNMPFDQFTIEQIAGDLLPNATLNQRIATGFNRNHLLNGEGGRIAEESRVDYVVDRIDTTATVWLGLTLGCCRCHDHKYDPFSQKSYYQLFAYFNNIAESGAVDKGGNAVPTLPLLTDSIQQRINRLNIEIADGNRHVKSELAKLRPSTGDSHRLAAVGLLRQPFAPPVLHVPEQLGTHWQQLRALQEKLATGRKALADVNNSVVETMVMEERPNRRDTFLLIRGAYDKYGDKVSPGVPANLAPLPQGAPNNRLGFARWLVSPANPLTARVTVNRAWQMFFGTGLVKTTEDFGVQGEPPSHPELLDWLAVEFAGEPGSSATGGSAWDVKKLHRLIVTSTTYRQSSQLTPLLRERDPDNRLLARGPRHRLPSPVLRDQALAISGLLVEKVGGPPVKPYQPPGIWEEMSFGKITYQQDKGPSLYRRSLYTFWRRTVGPTNLFDTPARQVCTVRLMRTNTPLHALITLNDVTYVEAARVFAERLLTQGGNSPEDRITLAFRLAAARMPTDSERNILRETLQRLLRQYGSDREAALKLVSAGEAPRNPRIDVTELAVYTALASLILNLDEVICKE
jgi:hypothetical protein